MKTLSFLLLSLMLTAFCGSAFAQGEWQRGLVAGSGITISGNTISASGGGGGSAKMFYSTTANAVVVYNYGASLLPFVYSSNGVSHAPSLHYWNAGILGDSGTLKNWYLRMDSTGVAEYDTCILYRSTNGGITWTATSLQILFGSGTAQSRPMASDVTHTLSVAPGDMLYMQFTAGSVSGNVGLATGVASSIEFDPK